MNQPTASIHIAKSLKANRTSQNLSQSMSAPTLKKEKKIKHENTTMCIAPFGMLRHHTRNVTCKQTNEVENKYL